VSVPAPGSGKVLVATVLSEILTRDGAGPQDVEDWFAQGGRLDSLQKRLIEIDRRASAEAVAAGEPVRRFTGSPTETEWRNDLYRVRHRVVHQGLRALSFEVAKRAIQVGLRASHAVQDLRPSYNWRLAWSGDVLDLPHITQSAGRLSRIFEAV
jgi:hypothetical protein